MTPIEKNITVFSPTMQVLNHTYPKRAKGLVKHNRACWIDSYSIRLLEYNSEASAHADYFTEDTKMSKELYNVIDNQLSKIQDQISDRRNTENPDNVRLEILNTLAKLKEDERKDDVLAFVKEQIEFLKSDLGETPRFDTSTDIGAQAFLDYTRIKETTKQNIVSLLEKLIVM